MFVTHQFIINMMPFKAICDSRETWTKHLRALGSGEMVLGTEEGCLGLFFLWKVEAAKFCWRLIYLSTCFGVWFINFQWIFQLSFSHSPCFTVTRSVSRNAKQHFHGLNCFWFSFYLYLLTCLNSQFYLCFNKRQ